MKGLPALSEELMIVRDLYLAEYTNSRVHIHNVSTAGGVRLIREAKQRGVRVTASVAVLNLAFEDGALEGFDTNFKVLPPLRETSDRDALKEGLKDGTIDCICSNHTPWHQEAKDLEFPYAEFGAVGLESAFGLAWRELRGILTLEELVDKFSTAPRAVLGQSPLTIEVGQPANLSMFSPNEEYVFEEGMIRSKSRNCPLIGESLVGRVQGIFNQGQLVE
jgi:dihydroorotase